MARRSRDYRKGKRVKNREVFASSKKRVWVRGLNNAQNNIAAQIKSHAVGKTRLPNTLVFVVPGREGSAKGIKTSNRAHLKGFL